MEKFKVTFEANNQQLKAVGTKHASDTYADIEATFTLGERWTDMDSVSAVWWNDFTKIATVLDANGKCIVPHEVLTRRGCVRVNLVGSVMEEGELVTRLTSYSAEAVQVNEKIKLTGSETSEITPSQFEQFVANVKADATASEQSAQSASESATASANSATSSAQSATASAGYAQNASESAITAENAKDDAEDARDEIRSMRATATTLEAGSDATASYSDGLLTLGIPRGDKGVKGDTGETGATPNFSIGTVETLEPTEDATATITGTAEDPVLNFGIPKGDTGEVSLEDLEALLPTETASGSIVTITDGQSVVPAKSLKVTLEPIQEGSGDPSPSNVRPISGWDEVNVAVTGVNLWDEEWEVGAMDSSAGQNVAGSNTIRSKNYIPVRGGVTYCRYASENTNVWVRIFQYDADKNYISSSAGYTKTPFTTDSNTAFVRFYANAVYGNTYNHDISINYPSTDHDYHAYQSTTYTTDLGRTVYGGTLDVVSGELVIDRGITTVGDLTWDRISAGKFYSTSLKRVIKKGSATYGYDNAISDCYEPKSIASMSSLTNGGMSIDTGGNVQIRDDRYETSSEFKTAMANATIVYELATPVEYQLTPQQVYLYSGVSNVWSEGGTIEVTYNADIQKYIEKKLG